MVITPVPTVFHKIVAVVAVKPVMVPLVTVTLVTIAPLKEYTAEVFIQTCDGPEVVKVNGPFTVIACDELEVHPVANVSVRLREAPATLLQTIVTVFPDCDDIVPPFGVQIYVLPTEEAV
jgi:hypothetical protein